MTRLLAAIGAVSLALGAALAYALAKGDLR